MNEWLVFSLILLGIWVVVFLLSGKSRKEMLWASTFTTFFGLTEPLFVPEYWRPPSLFNLAFKTGFDIESLIFSFAIGGLGVVLYELFFSVKHYKMSKHEMHSARHKWHLLALFSGPIAFIILSVTLSMNPIYSASIAMFVGGISAMLCRPDLKNKTFIGGVLFLVLYFVFFLSFNLIYPSAVTQYWNLSSISGILLLGIPIEELIFAFTFGMMWSGVYEHIKGYKIHKV